MTEQSSAEEMPEACAAFIEVTTVPVPVGNIVICDACSGRRGETTGRALQ